MNPELNLNLIQHNCLPQCQLVDFYVFCQQSGRNVCFCVANKQKERLITLLARAVSRRHLHCRLCVSMARSAYLPIATVYQHDYLWSCNQSTDEARARIAGVHGLSAGGKGWEGRRKEKGEERIWGEGDIQHLLTPLIKAVQWEKIFGYLWYHQSDRNHVWNLSEVASLVHTIKHQQVLTHFFLFVFVSCHLFGFSFRDEEAALFSLASPSALVLMNVELLTLALRTMTARGQLIYLICYAALGQPCVVLSS